METLFPMRDVFFLFTLFASFWPTILSHPQCINSFAPFDTVQLEFCSVYSNFGCCDPNRDRELRDRYNSVVGRVATFTCRERLKELLCQECSPYAAHLYATESTGVKTPLPGLCQDYCATLHQQCPGIISLATDNPDIVNAAAQSTEEFCNRVVTLDAAYCYPRIRDDADLLNWIEESRSGTGRYSDGCICLEEFANGLRNPLLAVHANDNTHRLFIAEQIGVVHVYLHDKTKLDTPFLDIRANVLTSTRTGDERGFLGLVFHPNHVSNRKLYVYYSYGNQNFVSQIRIVEYRTMINDINRVDLNTERVILEVDQPLANHNGGQLLFGNDGYLYAFLGDGGGAGDRFGSIGNGQDLTTLLGSVIRIDVDRQDNDKQYAIPLDNPYVNENPSVKRPEIYAYGTRNMWRCSVDRGDPITGEGRGRIFCGDVGQNQYEEVDIIVKGGNYGWRGREGNSCFDQSLCGASDEILPITVYDHSVGRSVTGGYVYRGCQSPKLQGKYVFGDFVNGKMFELTEGANNMWTREDICFGDSTICTSGLVNTYPTNILSFGEDEAGEVYVLTTDRASTGNTGGKVFRIVEPSESGINCGINPVPVNVIGSTTNFIPTQPLPVPCSPNPCANFGVCTQSGSSFICSCQSGWTGVTCTVSVSTNPCSPNPCANSGLCSQIGVDYTCTCQQGWTGRTCTVRDDLCNPNPCLNFGICNLVGTGLTCSCQQGWTGITCAARDPCSPNPCANSGVCRLTQSGTSILCECQLGWSGPICTVRDDLCSPNPCLNFGFCNLVGTGFTCSCQQGWTGITCAVRDPCIPNPCFNSGLCSPSGSIFTCACLSPWTGTTCTVRNVCNPNPCANFGSCSQIGSSFTCACQRGWTGTTCTDRISSNLCEPNPCFNGGACYLILPRLESFFCNCPFGFEGSFCQQKTDDICLPQPCGKSGVCYRDQSNTLYLCECLDGQFVFNQACPVLTNPCSLQPCGIGACFSSAQDDAAYLCVCPDLSVGLSCP